MLEDAKRVKQQQLDCVRQVQKLHDAARSQHGFSSAFKNAQETINLLDRYSDVLTQARVKTLSANFEVAYRKLARKEDMQLSAHINPETFDVELIDEKELSLIVSYYLPVKSKFMPLLFLRRWQKLLVVICR